MRARATLKAILDAVEQMELPMDEPSTSANRPASRLTVSTPSPPAHDFVSTRPKRPEKYVIGSLRGMDIEDLYKPGETIMVVMQGAIEDWSAGVGLQIKKRIIGVIGSGKAQGYGPKGQECQVFVDNMQGGRGGRRELGGYGAKWTIIGYAPPTKKAAREWGVRALYHFD